MLRKWCAGIVLNARLVDMLFIRCKLVVSFSRRLEVATDAKAEAEDGDPQLQCWFFDGPYINHYLRHGGSHLMSTLKLEVCRRTTVCNPLFVRWNHLELSAVLPRKQHRYYVQLTPPWREFETPSMVCVRTLSMFAYSSDSSDCSGQPFSPLLCKTAITRATVMLLVCFVRAAEFGALGLFLPSKFHVLQNDCCHRANKVIHILLSREIKADIVDESLLTMISNCEVDLVSALLAHARMNEID